MHFFLKCMCFTRKGMCSSTMNNVPDGTHHITRLVPAQHYTPLPRDQEPASKKTHTSLPLSGLTHMSRDCTSWEAPTGAGDGVIL